MQTRALRAALEPSFRLVFADAPFLCNPGPDVTLVYADSGPFRRWFRWLPEHPAIAADEALAAIEACLRTAMERDEGDGEWVGVLGFSQGAKVAASLLYRSQVRRGWGVRDGLDWRFGVLMAGRGPLVSLERGGGGRGLDGAGDLTIGREVGDRVGGGGEDVVLRVPTLHVHGKIDTGILFHKELEKRWCESENVRVVEWEGGHRVPIVKTVVEEIVKRILEMARDSGVEC